MISLRRYRLSIAYSGEGLCGWQIQPNGASIQQAIELALSTVLRTPITITGSGRTDALVNALEQVAHFDCDLILDPKDLLYRANALLPTTIRLRKVIEVDLSFHARYSVIKKTYAYFLHTEIAFRPFMRRYSHYVSSPLHLDQMLKASKELLGTHDFTTFTNQTQTPHDPKESTRTIYEISVEDLRQDSLFAMQMPNIHDTVPLLGQKWSFTGSGFGYKMVRNLMGFLIEIGKGRIKPSQTSSFLRAKDRTIAPPPAPAHALFLIKALYENHTCSFF